MLEKIKYYFNHKFLCIHWNIELMRWHYVHDPHYEPAHIEVECKCKRCNELVYRHIYGEDMAEWSKYMKEYKDC